MQHSFSFLTQFYKKKVWFWFQSVSIKQKSFQSKAVRLFFIWSQEEKWFTQIFIYIFKKSSLKRLKYNERNFVQRLILSFVLKTSEMFVMHWTSWTMSVKIFCVDWLVCCYFAKCICTLIDTWQSKVFGAMFSQQFDIHTSLDLWKRFDWFINHFDSFNFYDNCDCIM